MKQMKKIFCSVIVLLTLIALALVPSYAQFTSNWSVSDLDFAVMEDIVVPGESGERINENGVTYTRYDWYTYGEFESNFLQYYFARFNLCDFQEYLEGIRVECIDTQSPDDQWQPGNYYDVQVRFWDDRDGSATLKNCRVFITEAPSATDFDIELLSKVYVDPTIAGEKAEYDGIVYTYYDWIYKGKVTAKIAGVNYENVSLSVIEDHYPEINIIHPEDQFPWEPWEIGGTYTGIVWLEDKNTGEVVYEIQVPVYISETSDEYVDFDIQFLTDVYVDPDVAAETAVIEEITYTVYNWFEHGTVSATIKGVYYENFDFDIISEYYPGVTAICLTYQSPHAPWQVGNIYDASIHLMYSETNRIITELPLRVRIGETESDIDPDLTAPELDGQGKGNKVWMIVLAAVVGTGAFGAVASFLVKKYRY